MPLGCVLGDPIRPEQILYDTPHSLIEQSRRAVKELVTEQGTVPAWGAPGP